MYFVSSMSVFSLLRILVYPCILLRLLYAVECLPYYFGNDVSRASFTRSITTTPHWIVRGGGGGDDESCLSSSDHHHHEISTSSSHISNISKDNDDDDDDDQQQSHETLTLIIDVDNTLYSEQHIRANSNNGLGIEEQIIHNTLRFCQDYCNLTTAQAQELYHNYGSTIEGLRHECWQHYHHHDMNQWMQRYYQEVYNDIDVSGLLYYNRVKQKVSRQDDDGDSENENDSSLSSGSNSNTGYSHEVDDDTLQQQQLIKFLESLASHQHQHRVKVYLASNSPKLHVGKVLRALGMEHIPWAGILTPDTVVGVDDDDNNNEQNITTQAFLTHPTKHHPYHFYRSIQQQTGRRHRREKVVLLDDSKYNIQRVGEELGWNGILVQHGKHHGLWEALHQALSSSSSSSAAKNENHAVYEFNDVNYLRSKNVVDRASIHGNVYNRLAHELAQSLSGKSDDDNSSSSDQLCIVDLGAGLLSMLELFLQSDDNDDDDKPSLFRSIQKLTQRPLQRVVYYAYESNQALLEECRLTLIRLGFEPIKNNGDDDDHPTVFHRMQPFDMTVYLKNIDFRHETDQHHDKMMMTPHLVVGCCFADLFPPRELVLALHRFLSTFSKQQTQDGRGGGSTLLYFPITFTGGTQFVPPRPFGVSNQAAQSSIPSDTTAFHYYARALQECGQHLDPALLISEMKRYGIALVDSGQSNWHIDPNRHDYLWQTMMHFFARIGSPFMLRHGWDSLGWLRRAFVRQPKIVVSNVDLLFRLDRLESTTATTSLRQDNLLHTSTANSDGEQSEMKEIQFVATRQVTTINKETPTTLLPHQVRIKSVCSLISSGTELKIFQGMFSEDVLDVNIKGMSDQRMSYPLAYGYSLVGRVVECGSGIAHAQDIVGRLVFSFSPHATGVIADIDSVHLVPPGISAEDAMFMPAVETALSIVHDAHVRIGENVAVYGQGLIGLLVTSILSHQKLGPDDSSGKFGAITTFDTLVDRLAASGMLGASQALFPSEVCTAGPFDVSIEVSGNPRALQSAIDYTTNGGRIIVASWYGNANVPLKLGIDFHRSHKTIQTSQVSELPAELTTLWTKQRRFELTWELVKQIRPSRLITKRTTLDNAQEAYEALCNGTEIAVAFEY